MNATGQFARLLELSRKQRQDFAKLPAVKRRKIAQKNLRALGILTRSGELAPAFR